MNDYLDNQKNTEISNQNENDEFGLLQNQEDQKLFQNDKTVCVIQIISVILSILYCAGLILSLSKFGSDKKSCNI